jgi:hypothetical protein
VCLHLWGAGTQGHRCIYGPDDLELGRRDRADLAGRAVAEGMCSLDRQNEVGGCRISPPSLVVVEGAGQDAPVETYMSLEFAVGALANNARAARSGAIVEYRTRQSGEASGSECRRAA